MIKEKYSNFYTKIVGNRMKARIVFFLFLNLFTSCIQPFSKKVFDNNMYAITNAFSELGYYFEATLKFYTALELFKQKNNTTLYPEIICNNCRKRALSCDELIIKIKAKALRETYDAQSIKTIEIRKKTLLVLDKMTELICSNNMYDIKIFMAKFAQESCISCEGCQKVEWENY